MNAPQRNAVHRAMVRLAEGDRGAFDAVFAGLWPELLVFVRSAMAGDPEAEDLAQQTLQKIFFRISEFDTSRDGVAWAFGIAIYEVRTLRRKRQRRKEVRADSVTATADGRPSPEALHRAAAWVDDRNAFEPIKGVFGSQPATRAGLIAGVLAHSSNHYGQVVEYLRMNGIIPPASR